MPEELLREILRVSEGHPAFTRCLIVRLLAGGKRDPLDKIRHPAVPPLEEKETIIHDTEKDRHGTG